MRALARFAKKSTIEKHAVDVVPGMVSVDEEMMKNIHVKRVAVMVISAKQGPRAERAHNVMDVDMLLMNR